MNLTNGFLASPDPLGRLSAEFDAWEAVGAQLHKLVLSEHLRPIIRKLPPFPAEKLRTERELWRAGTLLAYMTQLYVLGVVDGKPVGRLPAVLAKPFVNVTERLGVPPILSYALQGMYNWRRIDPDYPVEVGNLTLLNNFLGGMDEEWFVTIHVNIEAVAGAALRRLKPAQMAATAGDAATVSADLTTIGNTLHQMADLLRRMPEQCNPDIYYHRVRPFMFGWKDNPAMPNGLVYEGCFGDEPQFYRGETGAQSSIIYAIDAALGVTHGQDEMRRYLDEMHDYMPPKDRAFVREVAAGESLRGFVERVDSAELTDAYNFAVDALTAFRRLHIEFAAMYILKPGRQSTDAVGTGGTPFTFYLKKHIRETEAFRIV